MFLQYNGVHCPPILVLGLIDQNLHRILIKISLSSHSLYSQPLLFLKRTQTFRGHISHIKVELDKIVCIQSLKVSLSDLITVSYRILQITTNINPRNMKSFISAIDVNLYLVLVFALQVIQNHSSETLSLISQLNQTSNPNLFALFTLRNLLVILVVVTTEVQPVRRLRTIQVYSLN